MLRLIASFFGGIVLANVVIVTFEGARSSISAKQVTSGIEQKTQTTAEPKLVRVADTNAAPRNTRPAVWVHHERFNAHIETKEPALPQWLPKP